MGLSFSFLSFDQEGGCKKKCMMWADMKKKKMPLLKYPLPSPTSVNIINAALAIKQTVSQLRERINADQE